MKTSIFALLALAVTPAFSETIHGVVIFSRHGDRTSKVYKGYQVTKLGARQLFDSGSFYRSRYIDENATHKIANISSDEYKPSQIWASGPDQLVLLQTATNFLQGLYPPLIELNETLTIDTLSNGTDTTAPLGGYQFVQVHSKNEKDPDSVWLKGSDFCPAYTNASATFKDSAEYISLVKNTASFYAQFNDALAKNLPPSKISYANAYDVFDLLNTASIHNRTDIVTTGQLAQLRYYADSWEMGNNYNRTTPDRSLGGAALGGAFLKQLNETVASKGALKLSLMTGSYNTFLQFFGLANLTTLRETNNFTGLPNYASSMVFELFSESESLEFPGAAELNIRFLFRNGTASDTELTNFPLFGQEKLSLPYNDFRSMMGERAIVSPKAWCSACSTSEGFCSQKEYVTEESDSTSANESSNRNSSGLTVIQAGIVGAMVTIGVVAIVGAALWLVTRRRSRKNANSPEILERKASKEGASSV